MTVLVIGGMGFVGSNLTFHLHKQRHQVIVFDNLVRRGSELNIPKIKDIAYFVHGDIRNPEDFNHIPIIPDIILHTAAQPAACTGYDNPTFDITNNYLGTLNVLEYARKNRIPMIFWSTNKVYSGEKLNSHHATEKPTRYHAITDIQEDYSIDGGTHSIYGLSKVCADLTCQEWAQSFDMNIIINRFSCLAGPGQFGKSEQGWVTHFCIATLFKLPITIYGFKGKQVRDILFVPDIISLIDIQIKNIHKFRGEVFNIGGSSFCNASLLETISIIEDLTKEKIKWSYDGNSRKCDQCVYISDTNKAKSLLGWEPTITMREGLTQIIEWIKENEKQLRELYT